MTTKRTINLFEKTNRADHAGLVKDSGLDAPVNFRMDKTNPTAYVEGLEDQAQYYSGSMTFAIKANDDVKLESVTWYLDGQEKGTFTPEQIDNAEAQGVVDNSKNDYQTIHLKAVDAAGNVFEEDIMDVQVSRNLLKLFQHNTIAQIVAGILAAGIALMIILLVRRKKRKEQEGK